MRYRAASGPARTLPAQAERAMGIFGGSRIYGWLGFMATRD
jgi:hypothetical protein